MRAVKPIIAIGDSLMVGTAPYLASLDGLVVHADYGMVLKWGLQWLRPARAIVWGLGSNNPGLTPNHMRRYIDEVAKHTRHIVVPTMRKGPKWDHPQDFSRVNTYLRRHEPRVQVADWAGWISKNLAHQGDGCHPDDFGYRARALLIVDALHRCGL